MLQHIQGVSVASAAGHAVLEVPHWWCRIGALRLLHGLIFSCGLSIQALATQAGIFGVLQACLQLSACPCSRVQLGLPASADSSTCGQQTGSCPAHDAIIKPSLSSTLSDFNFQHTSGFHLSILHVASCEFLAPAQLTDSQLQDGQLVACRSPAALFPRFLSCTVLT